jgi:hypothetical protein
MFDSISLVTMAMLIGIHLDALVSSPGIVIAESICGDTIFNQSQDYRQYSDSSAVVLLNKGYIVSTQHDQSHYELII